MKKKAVSTEVSVKENKSIFRQAGEMIGSIGAHIVQAKDNVVEYVSDEVGIAKKTTGIISKKIKKAFKKNPLVKAEEKVAKKVKKAVKKSPLKKQMKKTIKKAVKTSGRKTPSRNK
jgi:hypothetical protein